MPEPIEEVLIVGGGLAGLTAALHLAERGLRPLVLESDPFFPGGRVKGGETCEVNGWKFRLEHGIHGIWSPYRNLQAMLTRRKIRPNWVPAQEESWIFRRGDTLNRAKVGSAIRRSPIPAPFHYLNLFFRPDFLSALGLADLFSLFGVWSGLLYAIGVDPLKEDQPLEGLRLSDILKGWSPALRAFFIGLTRSGLAARPEDIPLAGYIAFMRFYTVLRRDSWAFSYMPADAGASLVDPLVAEIQKAGGRVQLGAKVVSLEKSPTGWDVTWQAQISGPEPSLQTCHTHQLILAVDAPASHLLLSNSPATAEKAAHLVWPRGIENAIVRIWFDKAPKPSAEAGIFSGDFILDNYFWLNRIQDQFLQWNRATGGSAIEAHIYGPPELLAEPDALLLSRAINDINSAFPELRASRIHQSIQRNPPVHTLFTLGRADQHLGTRTPWENLYCCGDWVRHPAPCLFLERAVLTGIAAANAVLETAQMPTWPLIPYLPPEPFVGWIENLMVRGRKARRKRQEESHV
jgi:isorenieratene synthase